MESETANHPCRRCKKPAKGSYCEACRAKNRTYAATAKAKKKGGLVIRTMPVRVPTEPVEPATEMVPNPVELAPVYYVGPDFVDHEAAEALAEPHVVTAEDDFIDPGVEPRDPDNGDW